MSGELIKLSIVIIITAVLITALCNRAGEYAFLLSLAAIAVLLTSGLGNLVVSIQKLKDLFTLNGNSNEYFITALKALGISYIATFVADLCRDFGLLALAQTAETMGKITIFILSIPLISAVLESTVKFLRL